MEHVAINWASSLADADKNQVVLNIHRGFLLPHIVIGASKTEIKIKLMHELVFLSPSDVTYRVKKENGLVIGSGDGFGVNRCFVKIKSDLNQDQTSQYLLSRKRNRCRSELNHVFDEIDTELRKQNCKISGDDAEALLTFMKEFRTKF